MKNLIILFLLISANILVAQEYGHFPKIEKSKLLRDLDLLYQGLDKYHSGMYWYSSKDKVKSAFDTARASLTKDLNVLEFHKIIAPLVALSNEDHTDISLNKRTKELINFNARYLPLFIVFLGDEMYCLRNGSDTELDIVGKKIISINGEAPTEIVDKIGDLFSSDGFIKQVKYSDLRFFEFAKYYYYFYGNIHSFTVEFEDETVEFKSLSAQQINQKLSERTSMLTSSQAKECLDFNLVDKHTAYMGIHDLGNDDIKQNKINNNLKSFLHNSFETIEKNGIEHLILDLSQNGGGTEGNEALVYSYLGENYQKYIKVKVKTQKAILDNGFDKPIKLKTFGLFERLFFNTKMQDGSYERKSNRGKGLMAYKKEPKHKFTGTLYVLISPLTYSGASELSNMLYSNKLGTFIGQETGGGYYGNTSGYSEELSLPHSEITIEIPSIQFKMNVDDSIPFGRGVIPHHNIIPTFKQYIDGVNASFEFARQLIKIDEEKTGDYK